MVVAPNPLLKRLRKAVQKVRFLLSFNVTKWLIRTASGQSSGAIKYKVHPGLLDVVYNADSDLYFDALTTSPSPGITRTVSSTWSGIKRTPGSGSSRLSPSPGAPWTPSDASPGEDINKRADNFIANFYERLRMERQISPQLRFMEQNQSISSGSQVKLDELV